MTKKRRQAHIPNQQPARRRRPVRRPDVAGTPQPEERIDLDGQPIFADDVRVISAAASFGEAGGPVETRPQWIGSTAQPQARTPGRRTAQLRRGATPESSLRVMAGQLPTFERTFLVDEMKRIAIIAGSLFAGVIVLAVVMR